MMKQVQDQPLEDDRTLCVRVVSTATVAYRPLALCELGVMSDRPEGMNLNSHVQMAVNIFVYLIHQSVKDCFTESYVTILGFSIAVIHQKIALKSMEVMRYTLRRDIYDLKHPGAPVPQRSPDPDPLAPVNHLEDGTSDREDLTNSGDVCGFLKSHYLRCNPSELVKLVRDKLRFVRYHASYADITLGGHSGSVNSTAFSSDGQQLASTSDDATIKLWDTATGYHGVNSVAFSPDGQQLTSACNSGTVKIWETTTGQHQQTLEGHSTLESLFKVTTQKPSQRFNAQNSMLSQDGVWIKTSSQSILWLPPDYRPVASVVKGRRIPLGSALGHVLLLEFALDHLRP
ncbi:wd-repeat protein [Colletotrichum incanum]|uniref:Wd-repeat protein n=1 Tax=Colletotrichum incanum TaxID=1573173 RepID=A0A162P931_COLIC|nr:wd-repeat protein [Colletotrichum incanum]OHW97888.1 WD-repeat protein [Colletotrichum incanum]